MPHINEPINKQRIENTTGIDKIVSLTIDCPGQHIITAPWNMTEQLSLVRPYFLHDLREAVTYKIGRTETIKLNLPNILSSSEIVNSENFQKTLYIEFFKETENDENTLKRAEEFIRNANTLLTEKIIPVCGEEYLIKVIGAMWPASYNNPKGELYSRYLMFKTEKDSKYIIKPNIQK